MKIKKQIKKDILKLLNDAEFDGSQKSKILNRIVNYTYGIAKKDVNFKVTVENASTTLF